ncbi:hypothetical protein BDY19DRAFT_1059131 [Irpex rosettiformis]|uniref:Uncharacterized protein n=1 Tax=Irpex rosettiformis TaxID=378272 RepID=A0ACB8TVI7_9APHY|nr:hypothetical protein BDY19DRAFT_1059131 [Irpex rosettiformis]
MQAGVFTSHKGRLHPALQPVSNTLERIRDLLYRCYVKAEQGDISKINHTIAADVIEQLIVELGEIQEQYAEEDVELCPIRLPRRREEPEPPTAAAVAGVGASLDSRQLVEVKKRALNDEGNQEESLESAQTGRPGGTKRARKDVPSFEAPPEESTTTGNGKSGPATSEESTTTRKLRSGTRQRTKSSETSGGNGPLRRSQRNRSVQSAKT